MQTLAMISIIMIGFFSSIVYDFTTVERAACVVQIIFIYYALCVLNIDGDITYHLRDKIKYFYKLFKQRGNQ